MASLPKTSPLAHEPQAPAITEGDFILKEFRFGSGETLAELRVHYRSLGTPRRDAAGVVCNAVLINHITVGSGEQFLRPKFSGALFGPGQALDARKYFLVLPDSIGHGHSSKPSDGLRRCFPRYGYLDMVEAQRRLLEEGLGVTRLRLVLGTSMGGMLVWLWGQLHPERVDALMPLACLPVQIAGRNRVWRRMIIDAIRMDPGWQNGAYEVQPSSLALAAEVLYFMGSNPLLRHQEAPTLAAADAALDAYVATTLKTADANDMLFALEACWDYDPGPGLERITAPLVAVNSADDLINAPELGILEREIKRVSRGSAVLLPSSPGSLGHGSHTAASLWLPYLQDLLAEEPRSDAE